MRRLPPHSFPWANGREIHTHPVNAHPTHISFGHGLGDQLTNTFAAFGKLSFWVVEVHYRK